MRLTKVRLLTAARARRRFKVATAVDSCVLVFAPFRERNYLMANIKSAKKRAHQAIIRRDHNMSLRTQVRTAIKNVKKAVAKGVMHRNAGDRHKSRLAHAVKGLK